MCHGWGAGLMPCPFSVIYGATKAFLTEFATSLACEVKRTFFSHAHTNIYTGARERKCADDGDGAHGVRVRVWGHRGRH
jgi:NADP-dependent 3-hydroxy acid dehydrogenase YdfG